jgi:LPXTG-motif cell wall-anchored protein
MSIINRRNAVLGWGVWQLTKVTARRKAKQAVPGTGGHAGLNKSALAGIGAATVAALLFWRKKSEDSSSAGT